MRGKLDREIEKKVQHFKDGTEVKSEYFNITSPDGEPTEKLIKYYTNSGWT